MPVAVYYQGSCGSGKSTHANWFWCADRKTSVIKSWFWRKLMIISADQQMARKLTPQELLDTSITERAYPRSERIARWLVFWCILLRISFVLDDTAFDVRWTCRSMRIARWFGFHVILVSVEASLEDCLHRNNCRERKVHEDRLKEIYVSMRHVCEVLSRVADEVIHVRT